MNDREKMLADFREALKVLNETGAYGPCARFVHSHATALEALLTEPTLEEVLAELADIDEPDLGVVKLEMAYPQGWYCEFACANGRETFFAIAPTSLQAASECLRRVKG